MLIYCGHACVWGENVWRGKLAFPHVLPHTHMLSASSLTGHACVHEGGCVERHTCLSTCPPSCTHDVCVISNWLCMCVWGRMCGGVCSPFHRSSLIHHMPSYQAFWSGLTGPLVCVYLASQTFLLYRSLWALGALLGGPHVAIGSLFDGLMALCQSHSFFWALGISWGPNVAIGSLFNGLMALCQSHSFFWALGDLLEGLMQSLGNCSISWWPIVTPTPFGPWRLFAPWFASSHVLWPSHSLTHSTWTGLSQCFARVKPSLASRLDLVWFMCIMVCFIPSPPPSHSLTLTTLTGLRQCFIHIKSLPCINNGLGLVGFVPIFTWHLVC